METVSYRVQHLLPAQRTLVSEIRHLFHQPRISGLNGEARLIRVATSVSETDPLLWLQTQPDAVKMYWSGRDDDMEIAGIGTADVYHEDSPEDYPIFLERLHSAMLKGDKGLRYYGGIRFSRRPTLGPDWTPFGNYRFWLPRFELIRDGDAYKLACNLVLPNDGPHLPLIIQALEELRFPVRNQTPVLPPQTLVHRLDTPDEAEWHEHINWALDAFRATRLDKVVLARKAAFTFADPLDPILLLRCLKIQTPECFHFCFQPDASSAFIGASPERLFKRIGSTIATEAVAGTRPRGTTPEHDTELARDLLSSDKDYREHEYVRLSIAHAIAPFCTSFQQDNTSSVMRLAQRMHLCARFQGMLRSDVSDPDLLRALHPTPAVGGFPTDDAIRAITSLESFNRGWYAGPVGWASADAAEFAVAIRSGLVSGPRLSLFSGAGIVEGSTPESEWDEIEQKIGDFTRLLVDGHSGS